MVESNQFHGEFGLVLYVIQSRKVINFLSCGLLNSATWQKLYEEEQISRLCREDSPGLDLGCYTT